MENNNPQKLNKIKICHIANSDAAVKFLLLPQLKFLMKEGYDVYAVCSDGKWVADIRGSGAVSGIKTIKIKRRISPFYDLITLWRLWNYFRKEKFDIVHTHTPKPGLLGQLAAKMAGVPIVINTIHGLYFQDSSSFLKRKFFILIEKTAATCSDLILSQNKEDIETIIKEKIAEPGKVEYLGNGIDTGKFDSERFSKEYIDKKKKQLNIPADFKIVGIVARLVAEKGYLDLFGALKSILEKFPKTALLSIGPEEPGKKDAVNRNAVEDYNIGKNAIFLGERDDVEQIYPLMDIFVLPSHREGFPRSVLEAMAEKRPVVASDIRGCKEEIENGKNGILVPAGNPDKLAEAIMFLLDNPDKAKEFGGNARARAVKYFDENIVFDKIKECYQKLSVRKMAGKHGAKRFQSLIKRIFDIVGALAGMILLSPVFLVVAILIKADSAGPVFFRYERIGKDGKPFLPYKFRTMTNNAMNIGLKHNVAENDDRITKIGKFLRKWGIDEFPQLINVFKGEMSLVGPRPTLRYQVELYNNFEKRRLEAKPGLAGWALIHGRNSLTWAERIKYDVWYVDNWSFLLDIGIILKTIYLVFIRQEGVYGKGGINDDPFNHS